MGFIKDLGFRSIILKCDNEPTTKALQDAVIHACVGVEVIRQGPPEGDHMANGRVEMAVREVKRQCGTIRICAERNTCVRIADDCPLLSWLPRFAAQVMRIGKDGKTSEMRRTVEDGESQRRKLERKFGFVKLEKTVSVSSFCKPHDSRNLRWSS